MRILSLFDGIGGARQALHNLNANVDAYVASEINIPAMKVAKANFPFIREFGDINTLDIDTLKKCRFDLMVFGSPCTDLSLARKNRESLQGKSSSLFYRAVGLLQALRPKYFLMENVASMSQASKDEISTLLGVQPVLINSKYFTGQHRERLYWCNWTIPPVIPTPVDFRRNLFNESYIHEIRDNIEISRAGLAYMDRKVKGGRTHWDFGHHSDTENLHSACIVANFKKGVPYNVLVDRRVNMKRRFLPQECEQLQGFPVHYTCMVSNCHRYETLGNSFTVPVIQHILKPIVKT